MRELRVKLDEGAHVPTRAYPTDAGLDLYSRESVVLNPLGRHTFDTGVHIELPSGYMARVLSKSGLFKHDGIITTGVVDAGYSGSVGVTLYNTTGKAVYVDEGQKIAQLALVPIATPEVVVVDEIEEQGRGNNGFGSSGR